MVRWLGMRGRDVLLDVQCALGPSQLAAPFVSTPPSELTAAWPSISPQERNADGAFALSLWLGRRSCVSKSDQYRRLARACLVLARDAEDERARVSLLHMAQVWFRLAEERTNETDERQLAGS
jgi:hypothetical protein